MRNSKISAVSMCGVFLAVAGCGGAAKVDHPDAAPAAGIVTYHGSPLSDATVVFLSPQSKKSGWTCAGKADASGKFAMSTVFAPGTETSGVPEGHYTAIVLKTPQATAASSQPMDMKAYDEMSRKKSSDQSDPNSAPQSTAPPSLVPAKYGTDSTSDLKVNIEKAGDSNIELKLVD